MVLFWVHQLKWQNIGGAIAPPVPAPLVIIKNIKYLISIIKYGLGMIRMLSDSTTKIPCVQAVAFILAHVESTHEAVTF